MKRFAAHTLLRLTLMGAAVAVTVAAAPVAVCADEIDTLTSTLATSKHDKARIAAVVALGRLKDKRALRPLVAALKDENHLVRAVAAAALGELGHKAALPALQQAASDGDKIVRKRATEAIATIRNVNELPAQATAKTAKKAGFGNSPRAVAPRPELYVSLKSAADDSAGKFSKAVRKERAELAKQLLARQIADSSEVTTEKTMADKYGIGRHNVDLSITNFQHVVRGPYVEIECDLRIALSNDRGKMLSFLSGGAKVQVPKKTFRESYLPNLRREALENAVKGIYGDMVKHMRRLPPS